MTGSDSNSPPSDEAVSETEDNAEDEDNNHNFASVSQSAYIFRNAFKYCICKQY